MKFDPFLIIRAGGVRRWHTVEELEAQTVAEHSWGVALLLMRFYPELSPSVLRAAILHDVPEYWTGDIPAQAKWRWPELTTILAGIEEDIHLEHGTWVELADDERRALKACDALELLLFHKRQARGRGQRSAVLDANMHQILKRIKEIGTEEVSRYAEAIYERQ